MDARTQTNAERIARRVGMSIVVLLIVWTIAAVATSIVRQLDDAEPAQPQTTAD